MGMKWTAMWILKNETELPTTKPRQRQKQVLRDFFFSCGKKPTVS